MGRMGLMICLRCRCRRSRSEVKFSSESGSADCGVFRCCGERKHYLCECDGRPQCKTTKMNPRFRSGIYVHDNVTCGALKTTFRSISR
jgi:hypothetical protein